MRSVVWPPLALTRLSGRGRAAGTAGRAQAMKRRSSSLALALVTGVFAVAVAAGAQGESRMRLHGGAFFSNCLFSHGSNNDPIVLPHQPGRSHAHTFFGNVSTNAHSSLASLRVAATTCGVRADRAAYWIPTLLERGREVRPVKAQFYYLMRGYAEMRPFPPGLKMIAGDARAVAAQSQRVVYWACGAGGGLRSVPQGPFPRVGQPVRASTGK
jgi:hypothetical protein